MINHRKFLEKSLAAGLGGYLSLPSLKARRTARAPKTPPPQARSGKPDIIFLMTDQQRWDALGRLNPHIQTPGLDRLAREGVIFRQAACQSPSCVPSRNSVMFGLYPSQLGVLSNRSHAIGDSRFTAIPWSPACRKPATKRRALERRIGAGPTNRNQLAVSRSDWTGFPVGKG